MEIDNKIIIVDKILEQKIVSKDFNCTQCDKLAFLPNQCLNGHIFCSSCIKNNKSCSVCQIDFGNGLKIAKNLYVEKNILNMEVHCLNYFKNLNSYIYEKEEGGCSQIMKLSDLKLHLELCSFKYVKCQYSKICGSIRKNLLPTHEKACQFNLVPCKFCKVEIQNNSMDNHIAIECEEAQISCNRCYQSIMKKELVNHWRDSCTQYSHKCVYGSFGCSKMLKRGEMEVHENKYNHHKLISSFMKKCLIVKPVYYQLRLDLFPYLILTKKFAKLTTDRYILNFEYISNLLFKMSIQIKNNFKEDFNLNIHIYSIFCKVLGSSTCTKMKENIAYEFNGDINKTLDLEIILKEQENYHPIN
ncbi:hypothetical protein DICPUDRAFT_81659 [Dictyostelium purpureum]|uniref:TRAF-type domain-containing protein n=1 Tax=Dictyostelium purpureum TaxID=5786 RepID=F0ZU67_DICPU|nr:uncharacterized protein DICPUDRAFT_81659 [Dictyostelium purpureum]EGC32505.1 hypothetical protein DICPUDRAFT_81659 [Dictyostelium purpureum]|eukprot:XP_003290955.1 hypothetical protein DICPUDRAFT_81659 [Dictyostelium purpureum]